MRTFLISLLVVSNFAVADHAALEACGSSDAKCVGRVLLNAVNSVQGGGGGAKTTYCQCYPYGGSYYVGLYRLSDNNRIADLSGALSSVGCESALRSHPSCR